MKLHQCIAGVVTFFVALGGASVGAQPAGLNVPLFQSAQQAQSAVLESLKTMVLIESGSSNAQGLAKMSDYLSGRLAALGMEVQRVRSKPEAADTLVARWRGTGKLRVMLLAHMDTVYPVGILDNEPFKIVGNQAFGPGIADDKGGIAVILHALELLRAQGWKDYAAVTVVINPDEEIGSRSSAELIAEQGALHDVVLSYEPISAKAVAKEEGVLLGAAGITRIIMEVRGRASHAGAAPAQGRNALIELAHQLLQLEGIDKTVPGAQLNWTVSQAGLVPNQIPAQATATADVRLLKPDAADKLLAALRSKAAQSSRVPDTTTTFTMEGGRPPYEAGERGLALAMMARRIYAEMDNRPLMFHPITGGGTDAGYAQRSGKPAVLESLGLPGWGYHARNEYIEIDAIVPRIYLTARLLMELARR